MGVGPKSAVQQFAGYKQFPDRRSKAIGDAFSYAAVFHPAGSIWLLVLYGEFAWIAMVQDSQ